jgi:hypothetical protein
MLGFGSDPKLRALERVGVPRRTFPECESVRGQAWRRLSRLFHVAPYGETTASKSSSRALRVPPSFGSLAKEEAISKLFHVVPYGETTWAPRAVGISLPTDYELGLLVGLLVGEGHFGGDGRQPQITLRMHIRHEAMFLWLTRTFPGGRLYGPYDHSGRRYYQWMARGAFLRNDLAPLLEKRITPELDEYSFGRFQQMMERYSAQLRPKEDAREAVPGDSES